MEKTSSFCVQWMWRQFCWYRFVVSVNCVITQSLKTDYIFPTIFCIRTLFKFWDHLVGQNYFFRCTAHASVFNKVPSYKTSGLLWDASEGTFKETYCVGLAFFLQILFPLQVKLYKTSHSLLVLQRAATCFGQFRLFCRRVWFGPGWATEHRGKCQHCQHC